MLTAVEDLDELMSVQQDYIRRELFANEIAVHRRRELERVSLLFATFILLLSHLTRTVEL